MKSVTVLLSTPSGKQIGEQHVDCYLLQPVANFRHFEINFGSLSSKTSNLKCKKF